MVFQNSFISPNRKLGIATDGRTQNTACSEAPRTTVQVSEASSTQAKVEPFQPTLAAFMS